MLKYIVSLIFILIPFFCLYGQPQQGTGAILDERKYVEVPLAAPTTSDSYHKLPPRYSLKPYCPTPGDQGITGTCVGWAVSYAARSIMEALEKGWTRENARDSIDASAFSPSFIYNMILEEENINDCSLGGYIADALNYLRYKGTVRAIDFPFTTDCTLQPTQEQMGMAWRYRVQGFQRLTFQNQDQLKIDKVRESIANNLPVIVGIKILNNLRERKHKDHVWLPTLGDPATATTHAMLVVGYDDTKKQFELMNSWGTDWGNDGFIYLSYSDFAKQVREAYHLLFAPQTPVMVNQINLSADIIFKQLHTDLENPDAGCLKEEIGTMSAKKQTPFTFKMINTYESWTGYQIRFTPKTVNMIVYIFSVDMFGNTDLLYPFQPDVLGLYGNESPQATVDALVPYSGSTIALPHEDYCMQLDSKPGTVNCFLFSKKDIDIAAVLKQIETTEGSVADRVHKALGSRLADERLIQYQPFGIGFDANVADDAIVPIIVDINHAY